MGVAGGQVVGGAFVGVAGQAVVGIGAQVVVDGERAAGRGGGGANPGHAVIDAVVVLQGVQTDQKLVGGANSKAVAGGNAFFVQAGTGAVAVGFGGHGVDAQARVFAGLDIEVARDPAVVVAAQGGADFMLVNSPGRFADLVDRATGRTASKQHGGRAAQQFNTVVIEGVALVKGRVAHAVYKNVAGGGQGETAQANVFFAALGCLERDACGVVQHVFQGVQVAVVNQLFRDHGNALGNVAQLLFALADGGFHGTHGVFAGGRFGFFGYDHRLERFGRRGGVLLCHGAHRACQQQGADGQ